MKIDCLNKSEALTLLSKYISEWHKSTLFLLNLLENNTHAT